ncbi:hypothetical protein ACRALDRAFT_205500 [Sodiomyces alcalophilus JCM 7366]|uniref:uncharacterized protein n=1 Tax=Sodiomyces alcalophilus JCM 7366 TaxID=591952 RepID=UPI0039B48E9F
MRDEGCLGRDGLRQGSTGGALYHVSSTICMFPSSRYGADDDDDDDDDPLDISSRLGFLGWDGWLSWEASGGGYYSWSRVSVNTRMFTFAGPSVMRCYGIQMSASFE